MNRPRPRRMPQRTCIACRLVRAKRDLVRIVRTPEGAVVVDPTGKRNGRGAYLCRQRTCWRAGMKRGTIERALKQPVSGADLSALESYIATLPEELTPSPVPADDDDHDDATLALEPTS